MKLKHTVGFIGGRPHSSYYFVGIQGSTKPFLPDILDDVLFYLDPHYNQEYVSLSPTSDITSYFCHQRSTAKISEIDESLALGFYCRDYDEFENFVQEMERVGETNEKLFWFEDSRIPDKPIETENSSGDDFSMDDF